MQYHEVMKRCEKYMEDNIRRPVTAGELARMSGYSLYHFCHVFKAYYGTSPGEYIRNLRLKCAVADLASGKTVTEAAFDCGFDTGSGFSKAFRRQYGISAKAWLQISKVTGGNEIMKVEILQKEEIRAVGYEIPAVPDKELEKKAAYWSNIDFSSMPPYPENLNDQGEIAMWYHPEEVSGEMSYFFGCVSDTEPVPEGFREVKIPAAQYAVFEVELPEGKYDPAVVTKKVKEGWVWIFTSWMNAQDTYKFDERNFCFEYYLGEKAQIYIPVKSA